MGVRFPRVWNDEGSLSAVKCGKWRLFFGRGRFDDWCVFVFDSVRSKFFFPLDYDYLYWIKCLGERFGNERVYFDFVLLYDCVRRGVSNRECYVVTSMVDEGYVGVDTQVWWVIFFMTMYAECMKENTRLGKRIKRLGVYNVLVDGDDVEYVTQYMKNDEGLPGWFEYLDRLMRDRGF